VGQPWSGVAQRPAGGRLALDNGWPGGYPAFLSWTPRRTSSPVNPKCRSLVRALGGRGSGQRQGQNQMTGSDGRDRFRFSDSVRQQGRRRPTVPAHGRRSRSRSRSTANGPGRSNAINKARSTLAKVT